jgi:hypothetical protein
MVLTPFMVGAMARIIYDRFDPKGEIKDAAKAKARSSILAWLLK